MYENTVAQAVYRYNHIEIDPTLIIIILNKEPNLKFVQAAVTKSHRDCCKGDDASQWGNGKFDPCHAQTP